MRLVGGIIPYDVFHDDHACYVIYEVGLRWEKNTIPCPDYLGGELTLMRHVLYKVCVCVCVHVHVYVCVYM